MELKNIGKEYWHASARALLFFCYIFLFPTYLTKYPPDILQKLRTARASACHSLFSKFFNDNLARVCLSERVPHACHWLDLAIAQNLGHDRNSGLKSIQIVR